MLGGTGGSMHQRLLATLPALLFAGCQPSAPQSVLIDNAVVFDGSGEPSYHGAVRIDGDRIVAVGALRPLKGERIIDAGGLVLAPGFIDTHSHHDRGMDEHRNMLAVVSQGVTTIVRGADGNSGLDDAFGFLSLADFNEQFEQAPAAVNVASFSPHGGVRTAIMGSDFRRAASAGEIERMSALVADDMQNGALGLATGLEYMPGIFATTDEVIALSKTAAAAGGRYMSHVRDEDDRFTDAVDELIRIGREADIPVHISHIKLADKKAWGSPDAIIARLDRARADGIEVTADIYPYLYWQSVLSVLFPDKDYSDRDVARFTFERTTAPDTLILTSFQPDPSLAGLSIARIAALREQDVESTLLQLTQESDRYLQETGKSGDSIIAKGMTEDDVSKFMHWQYTNICSDGGHAGGHPRGYGAFPRFFSRYVNSANGISRAEAIRKMTSLSADNVGIAERGMLRAGYFADLVLLDPETFRDQATFDAPQKLSGGVKKLWVNGVIVFDEGEATGRYPGRLVQRHNQSRN